LIDAGIPFALAKMVKLNSQSACLGDAVSITKR